MSTVIRLGLEGGVSRELEFKRGLNLAQQLCELRVIETLNFSTLGIVRL